MIPKISKYSALIFFYLNFFFYVQKFCLTNSILVSNDLLLNKSNGDNNGVINRNDFFNLYFWGPVLSVTLGWFALYFSLLFQQSETHFTEWSILRKKEKEAGKTGRELTKLSHVKRGVVSNFKVTCVNTTVRNTVEQSVSFLILVWAASFSIVVAIKLYDKKI